MWLFEFHFRCLKRLFLEFSFESNVTALFGILFHVRIPIAFWKSQGHQCLGQRRLLVLLKSDSYSNVFEYFDCFELALNVL